MPGSPSKYCASVMSATLPAAEALYVHEMKQSHLSDIFLSTLSTVYQSYLCDKSEMLSDCVISLQSEALYFLSKDLSTSVTIGAQIIYSKGPTKIA